MSTGEAFLGENWPTEAVWRQVGGHCFEDHAKGSFETDKFEVNEGGGLAYGGKRLLGQQDWKQSFLKVNVTVSGNYGPNLKGLGVRDDFMHDLLHHHNGDGGVWSKHGARLLDFFGGPREGWYAASWTAIRRDDDGDFWVNIELKVLDAN